MNEELKKLIENEKHLLFLLDATGSMQYRRENTISALNEYIQSLRGQDISFTLLAWSSVHQEVMFKGKLDDCPVFTYYDCKGMTPLWDTVFTGLSELNTLPGKKMLVVLTDGEENSSVHHNKASTSVLMNMFKSQGNEVIFLGADLDLTETVDGLGLEKGNTISYSVENSSKTYRGLTGQTQSYFGSTDDKEVS